uniref:Cytochrome P450 n=1 Tax=Picea sitchensis TaxID=3332 RepID=C0PSR9_PICSI|nr:unknown [Picea sitchensis]
MFDMGFEKLLQPVPVPAILIASRGGAATTAFGLTATFVFFFSCWIFHQSRRNERLPPGPYPWPIIGNLHQLRLPFHRNLKDLADKYGPILFLRFGSVSTVVVSSSEMAKQFYKTHDLIFASRPPTSVGKYFFYNFKDIAFAPYGDHWRKMRKICVLELLTAKRIESFKHVRQEEVSAMIRSIWEESESGRIAVNVTKAISSSLANILWRILARKKFSDKDLGTDGKGFTDLVQEVSTVGGSLNIGDFIPYLDRLDLQGIKRSLKKANTRYDVFAEKMIDEHVNARAATNGQAEAEAEAEAHVKDIIDVLLEMAETDKLEAKLKRETIKAVTYDLFAAGMETSANALEWAMSELLRHPHAMKKLQEEIESVVGQHGIVNESDLGSMVYLQCVVKETLRLYPSLPLALPHASVEAVTVGGYYIPKKTMVILNVWALGRDPMVWGADASEFKPERFMQVEEHGTDLSGGQSDFRMLPFGAGRRSCPGSAMAILTVQFTLAQLLNTFDWRVEGDPSELDMKEACATTMPRQTPLFAYPSLKRPLSL